MRRSGAIATVVMLLVLFSALAFAVVIPALTIRADEPIASPGPNSSLRFESGPVIAAYRLPRRFVPVVASLLHVPLTRLVSPKLRATAGQHALGLVSGLRSHGLLITLTVPRARFPRNALIQVKLTVKNVSRHTIFIRGGLQAPRVIVLDASNAVVFEPIDPLGENSLFDLTGPGPRSQALHKGAAWIACPYLVLLGNRISFSVLLGKVGSSDGTTITGKPVSVDLVDEAAPQVSVTITPALHAVVIPSVPVTGPMYVVEQTSCVTPDGTYSTGDDWMPTGETVLIPQFRAGPGSTPGCAGRRIWHALAG